MLQSSLKIGSSEKRVGSCFLYDQCRFMLQIAIFTSFVFLVCRLHTAIPASLDGLKIPWDKAKLFHMYTAYTICVASTIHIVRTSLLVLCQECVVPLRQGHAIADSSELFLETLFCGCNISIALQTYPTCFSREKYTRHLELRTRTWKLLPIVVVFTDVPHQYSIADFFRYMRAT